MNIISELRILSTELDSLLVFHFSNFYTIHPVV